MQNDTQIVVPEQTEPTTPMLPQVVISKVTITPEEYLHSRVVRKIETYIRLAKRERFLYRLTSLTVIICSATVPVLLNIGEKYLPGIDLVAWATILSLIVTILVSVEKLFRFRDHWRSYEAVAGSLHYELFQYQAETGNYKQKKGSTQQDKFRLFVNSFEGIIKQEKGDRSEWETQNSQ